MSRAALNELIFVATNPASYARGREVFVYARGTEDEATVYAAETGGSVLAQPLVTDEGGRPRGSGDILGWVEEGSYDLSVDGQVIPWEAAKGGGGGAVSSVAGRTGDVVLVVGDVEGAQAALGYTAEDAANKDTDTTLAANSNVKYPSQKAIKAYVDGLLAASDAVIYKGVIDCSTNPKYPAANAGHLYRVSKAGKIGGATGLRVEVGDTLLCNTDGSAEGTYAEVSAKWNVIQADIDRAVTGPESSADGVIALFDGSSGKSIRNGGYTDAFFPMVEALLNTLQEASESNALNIEGIESEIPGKQPLDADLTAIAALSTATFGRSLLALADAAAARSAIEAQKSLGFTAEDVANKDTNGALGTSDAKYPSQKAVKTYVDAGDAGRQPLDSDLTAIAALATQAFGRELLTKSTAADIRAQIGAQFAIGGSFDVKDPTYGAKGDGVTDDSTAIQAAITAAESAGGIVYFPPGTYIVGTTLTLKSKVHLRGAGPEATILKLKNSAKTNVVKTSAYGAAGIRDFSIRDLTVDGNSANNSEGSGVLIDGQKFVLENVDIHHCAGDNLNCQMTTETVLDTEGGDEGFVRNVRCWLAGSRNLRWNIRDGHLIDVICIAKDSGSAVTNILVDTEGYACKFVNCHAWGQSKYAWQVKGDIRAINCSAEGGVTANVVWEGDNNIWLGGEVFKDGSNHGEVGFLWATGKGYNSLIDGVQIRGCAEPLKFTSDGGGSKISAIIELASGKKAVNGSPAANTLSLDLIVHGGGTVGNAQKVRLSGPEATSVLREHLVDGDSNARYELRADGMILLGPGNTGADVWMYRPEKETLRVGGRLLVEKKSEEVASAATITVKDGMSLVKISGSTEITKVNATTAGHVVTFLILSTAKFADGSNLKLSAAGPVTADDTISMICDGTNWYEIGRSVN